MSYEDIIGTILLVAVFGFAFGLFNHRKLIREGGQKGLAVFSDKELNKKALSAKRRALVGHAVFFVSIVIMLTLSAIFGPAGRQ